MIPKELNEKLTKVGQATPAGSLLRQYWQPAALLDEIKDKFTLPVNLLGERLALTQDSDGKYTLATRISCPKERPSFHPNTVNLDVDGPSYPVIEKNGILFAFLGDGTPPPLPNFDCFRAPESHSFAFKGFWECNWLQALEVGIDPAHASFLHRFLKDEDPKESYGKQFRDTTKGTQKPMTKILRDYPRPDISVEETDYGLKITALRHMADELTHVRITNSIFPTAICIPMSKEMTITQWHVPVDDENCYWYTIFTSFDNPIDQKKMRMQRLAEHTLPEYLPIRNKQNNYKYNSEEQRNLTYTGMGLDINVHDQWAVEMMGKVQDRTREHLGRSDVAIVRYRRMLRKAMAALEAGEVKQLPMQSPQTAELAGPLSNDAIAPTENWKHKSELEDQNRRAVCPWDALVKI